MKVSPKNIKNSESPNFLASHDSATGMVMALSDFLKNKAFEGVGVVPTNELYARFINTLPTSWRKKLYSLGGEFSAYPSSKIDEIDASELERWVYDQYPEKEYPAIAVGSSNGAMIHLCAAMGIPWLPQTFLVPLNKGKHFPVDEPKETMNWAERPADTFLENNPGWQLHHMMDPNQDRLRVSSVAYFRIKKAEPGKWYEKFIQERLSAGGRIIYVDCSLSWPVRKINERHYFQFGGLGGLEPKEYYEGSTKVEQFLEKSGSKSKDWDAPKPNAEAPEAEWGLQTSLIEKFRSYCDQRGIPSTRISFHHPQDLSSPVANLFRRWYEQEGSPSKRLLVETFNMISPFLSLKKGCIPYWFFFNVDMAAKDLQSFLKNSKPFDEIYMMMLSHGKHSVGMAEIDQWKSLLRQAGKKHSFIGTSPEEYPVDMAVYARYSKNLEKTISGDHPLPPLLPVPEALKLLKILGEEKVQITDF